VGPLGALVRKSRAKRGYGGASAARMSSPAPSATAAGAGPGAWHSVDLLEHCCGLDQDSAGVIDDVADLLGYFVNAELIGTHRHLVGERGAVGAHLLSAQVVPDRQQ
jgi:hypothetical protein